MARYEVDVIISSGRDLKNVNWRNGDLKPYVVAWIDPSSKLSSKVAVDGDTDPTWDDAKITITIPTGTPLEEATLFLDVVHAGAGEDTKPLVGSARLPLRDVVDEVGVGSKSSRTLKLKRPSGRPQGKLELKVAVKEPARYYDRYAPTAPAPAPYAYGQPSSREYYGGSGGGYGYGQPAYAPAAPPAGYPYAPPAAAAGGYGYGGAPQAPAAGGYGYGGATQAPAAGGYGYGGAAQAPSMGAYGGEEKKKSKFGMGTGLAVGAAAGVLGGLALAEGIGYVEDKIADSVTERVERNLDDDGYDVDF